MAQSPPLPLFTHHAHVLLLLAEQPFLRTRDIAVTLDVTERTVQAIVADLVRAGYLVRTRHGRRNRYAIRHDRLRRAAQPDAAIVSQLAADVEATARPDRRGYPDSAIDEV